MRNRQGSVQKRILFSVFAGVACLFFFTCGIPVYYVIEPPVAEHIPTSDSVDASGRYFGFTCPYSESSENSDFSLLGTGIYYRIYDSQQAMESDISAINSRNAEYSENGFLKMKELNYQQLNSTPRKIPVVQRVTSTRSYQLWLCDEAKEAGLYDVTNGANTKISVPVRSGTYSSSNSNPGFQFTSNSHPESGDQDTQISNQTSNSSTNSNEWYVNLYAVSIGREANLSQHYSSLLHLGNLKITYNE